MRDNTPISVFTKRVCEVNAKLENPRFTNGQTIQVAIKDGKESDTYTENISKDMEFVNEHGNHPILSQCVCFPFDSADIDQDTFCSFIRMQHDFLHNIRHIEIHGLASIDI
jgi:hypothetical protein